VQATLDGYDSVLSNTVTVNLNNAQTGTTFLTIAQGDISNNTAYEHASAG
jgi:hypothetical protein